MNSSNMPIAGKQASNGGMDLKAAGMVSYHKGFKNENSPHKGLENHAHPSMTGKQMSAKKKRRISTSSSSSSSSSSAKKKQKNNDENNVPMRGELSSSSKAFMGGCDSEMEGLR